MLKIRLDKDKTVELDIPENLTGITHRYHERYLADNSLSDVDVVLLSVHFIEYNNKKSGASYVEVKKLFVALGRKEQPNFAVAFHRAKKQNFIEDSDGIVRFQIRGIKHIERILGLVGRAPVFLIKAGQSFSAVKLFEEFLIGEVKEPEILLCDSHISPSTLYPFSVLKGTLRTLKILSSNVYESEKLNEYKEKLRKEANVLVDIRQSYKIHDRYLVSGKSCWGIGTSIKDLGNKDTVISELPSVASSLSALFIERWAESNRS